MYAQTGYRVPPYKVDTDAMLSPASAIVWNRIGNCRQAPDATAALHTPSSAAIRRSGTVVVHDMGIDSCLNLLGQTDLHHAVKVIKGIEVV